MKRFRVERFHFFGLLLLTIAGSVFVLTPRYSITDPFPLPLRPPCIYPDTVAAWEQAGFQLSETGEVKSTAITLRRGITDADLEGLPVIPVPFSLDLSGEQVTDKGLKHLTNFQSLTTLNLGKAKVTDEGLKHLADLTNLTSLTLPDTVTWAGMKNLGDLKRFTYLKLRLTNTVLQGLSEAGLLHVLSEAGAGAGKRPTKPEEVSGFGFSSPSGVTDEGLQYLAGLTNLTILVLDYQHLTDAGLRHLKGFTKLTYLRCQEVTDQTLESLAEMDLLHALHLAQTAGNYRRPTNYAEVDELDLSSTAVTDAGLKHLAGLKKLNTLNLRKVTDGALASLAEIGLLHALSFAQAADGKRPAKPEDVVSLGLSGAAVTNDGLRHLSQFHNLTTLQLGNTKVTDEGLTHLADFKNLTALDLWGTQVKGPGLNQLKGLKNLSTLTLRDEEVTDAWLEGLAAADLLHALSQAKAADGKRPTSSNEVVSFDLISPQVTDEGLKQLKGFEKLATLRLYSTRVTDEGLKHLAGLTSLTTINLGGTKVTAKGVEQLQKELPDCKIITR